MSVKRAYAWIALLILVVFPVVAIMSCQAPAATPTVTRAPPPTAPPPPPPTSPPPPPTATSPPPPTAAPTAVPTMAGFEGQPLAQFTTADFSGSGTCSLCHGLLFDEDLNDVSIDTQWRSVMMANAARDPYFLAKVSTEIVHNPGLRSVLEDKCAVCHMPMAHTQARVDGQPVAMFEDGFLNPGNELHEAAIDGVSCNLCHQIEDEGLGTKQTFSGGFVIDTSTEPPDRPAYGPFPDQFTQTMMALVGYTPQQGEQVEKAELCGVCHTLYTPFLDDAGNVLGEFPEQTPLLEWKHSAYSEMGMPCQSCHMPPAVGGVAISNKPNPPKIPERTPFFQHHFVGGNAFMLELFKANGQDLGLTCSAEDLNGSLQRVLKQLRDNTVELAVSDVEVGGDALSLALRLENKAGHKFPAGFPSRRAWLHLKVTDANGQVVFESGKPRVDGTIVGADADEDAAAFERHYDVISSEEEVQIYEVAMHDPDERVTYTLLQAAGYLKDNRLLPRGFDKETAGDDFATKGLAAVDDSFLGGVDEVTYQISTKGHSGPYQVSVELLYQAIAYGFIRDLEQYDTDPAKEFLGYYDAADKMPVVIATLQETVG